MGGLGRAWESLGRAWAEPRARETPEQIVGQVAGQVAEPVAEPMHRQRAELYGKSATNLLLYTLANLLHSIEPH